MHAGVARNTFPSQNVQSTPCPELLGPLLEVAWRTPFWREAHFQVKSVKNWQVRTTFGSSHVQKRCGAKHISKSKYIKHLTVGTILKVEMSQQCTPVWRETHFQVKMYKTHHARNCSDHFSKLHVEKVHAFVA